MVSYDQLQDELLPWSVVDMDQNCGNRQKKLEHAGIFYMQNVNAANLDMHTQSVTHTIYSSHEYHRKFHFIWE